MASFSDQNSWAGELAAHRPAGNDFRAIVLTAHATAGHAAQMVAVQMRIRGKRAKSKAGLELSPAFVYAISSPRKQQWLAATREV
jgi:hypothetical protein